MNTRAVTASQMKYMLYLLLALVVADGILSNFLVLQNMGFEVTRFSRTW
jgi:hypothetical protein